MGIYDARIDFYGSNRKERFINTTQDYINNLFNDSLSTYEIYLNNSEETDLAVIISKDTADITLESKTIILQLDKQIKIGDLVNWNSEYWICVKITSNSVYTSGIIYKCNNELNWIDNFGVIQNTPCFLSDKSLYSIGIKDDLGIVVPDGKFIVIIPNNTDTIKINRNDRFIFNHKYIYKTTKVDEISTDGIIILNMQEEFVNNVNDNLELNIADYNNDNNYEIFVDNSNLLSLTIGMTHQIDAIVKNNGITLTTQPTLTYSTSNFDIVEVNQNGLVTAISEGNADVLVEFNGISNRIEFDVVEIISDNYNISISGNEYIRKGEIVEYITLVTNNGVEEVQPVTFEDIDTTLVEIIETTSNSIKLKGLKSEGSFSFSAKLDIDEDVNVDKTVVLKYLF